MMHHRFINDGVSPIAMGSVAEHVCICGRRGTRSMIERHITESNESFIRRLARHATANECGDDTAVDAAVADVDTFGGGTMSHYLPNEPRKPAPTGETAPLPRPDRAPTPEPLPPPPTAGTVDASTPSIAELFQDMLRLAFQAGGVAATRGESFETWYHREVLR